MTSQAGERFIADHRAAAAALPGAGSDWIDALRSGALDRFRTLGLPTTRLESWKYTRLNALEQRHFKPRAVADALPEIADDHLGGDGFRLVFVNGAHVPALSDLAGLPGGLRVVPIAEALEQGDPLLRGTLADDDLDDAFTALNTAYLGDGVLIELADGCVVDRPLQLLFVAQPGDEFVSHPRNIVVAGANSRLLLVESYVAATAGCYFTNACTELHLAPGARVEHVRLQSEADAAFHIGRVRATVGRDAGYVSRLFSIGALLARTDLDVRLARGAECVLDGLYMAEKRQHVDHQTRVDHAEPNGSSSELYKGILDGAARAVFGGAVLVRPDAQQTDARQMNQNLLLSARAEVDSKPQLEIYADDVKCTHGATIGQLDPTELFYLRTRGLDEGEARNLLIHGFANEMVERVGDAAVRAHIHRHLDARLPGRGELAEGMG